jgi:hypothetical protein
MTKEGESFPEAERRVTCLHEEHQMKWWSIGQIGIEDVLGVERGPLTIPQGEARKEHLDRGHAFPEAKTIPQSIIQKLRGLRARVEQFR